MWCCWPKRGYEWEERRLEWEGEADIPKIVARIEGQVWKTQCAIFRRRPFADNPSVVEGVKSALEEKWKALLGLAWDRVERWPIILKRKELSPKLKEKEHALFSPAEEIAWIEKKHSLRPSQLRVLLNDVLSIDISIKILEQMLSWEFPIDIKKIWTFRDWHEHKWPVIPIILPPEITINYHSHIWPKTMKEYSTIAWFKRRIWPSVWTRKSAWWLYEWDSGVRSEIMNNTMPPESMLVVPTTCIGWSKSLWTSKKWFKKDWSWDRPDQFQADLVKKLTWSSKMNDKNAWIPIVLWLRSAVTWFDDRYILKDFTNILTTFDENNPVMLYFAGDGYYMMKWSHNANPRVGMIGSLSFPKI